MGRGTCRPRSSCAATSSPSSPSTTNNSSNNKSQQEAHCSRWVPDSSLEQTQHFSPFLLQREWTPEVPRRRSVSYISPNYFSVLKKSRVHTGYQHPAIFCD